MPEQLIPKYSIILPVRNGGEYVKLCINSILSQTIKHFNLIVLDNCSTDGTLEYVQSLLDNRIVIHPSPKPLTIEDNWGRIAQVDSNEFITLIGHDDILYPGYLGEMERLIDTYPGASLYQTHYTYINGKGRVINKCKPMPELQDGPAFLKSYMQFTIDIMGTGYMMRSADFKRLGGISPYPNLILADLELWLKLTDISFKATSPIECFSYRVHLSTTFTTSNLIFQQALERFVFFLVSLQQKNKQFSDLIHHHGELYLLNQCKASSHRLLKSPKSKNDGLSIDSLILKFKQYAVLLGCGENFKPTAFFPILVARVLYSNAISRYMFLIFEKMRYKIAIK